MKLSLEHDRVVRLIKESISLMCKTSLNYDIELNVEGLLGITLDKKDIFLVNINESFCNETAEDFLAEIAEEGSPRGQKRSISSDDQGELTEFKEEHSDLPSSTARKRRGRNFRRHHKKNSAGTREDPEDHPTDSPAALSKYPEIGGEADSDIITVKHEVEDFSFESAVMNDADDSGHFRGNLAPQGPNSRNPMILPISSPGDNVFQHDQMPPSFASPGMSTEDDSQTGDDQLTERAFDPATDYQSTPDKVMSSFDTHGVKISTCRYCEEVFSSVPVLIRHELKVHNHPWFTCTYTNCEKTFQTKSALMRHHKVHAGQGFTCSVCKKVFATRSDLRNHSWIHDNTKFPCKLCGKIFNHPRSVLSHEKKWHNLSGPGNTP